MSLITYRWPAAICGTELGLWHGIILTVSSQQVSHNATLHNAMLNAASMPDLLTTQILNEIPGPPTNLHNLFLTLRDRHSSNPIDKVFAIAFPFQKRVDSIFHVTFPIYDPSTPVSIAWGRLISSIASTNMNSNYWNDRGHDTYGHTTTIQLLCLFPHPSRHHWFPSWTQVLQYPDVSIRDNDPIPVPRDMDCSLRIMSGRIYRDCSLELKRRHTSKGEAAYHCSMGMGSETAELVATVPGVELDIDPRSKYVLVDISPDPSLWDKNPGGGQRHVHRSTWVKSVIIVCEEVDNLAHAQPVQVTKKGSSAIVRYHLRRVTTLHWHTLARGHSDWLPFEPSLEHIKSVVYGVPERLTSLFPPDTFCNPAVARDLMKNEMYEWDKYPVYEVYLV